MKTLSDYSVKTWLRFVLFSVFYRSSLINAAKRFS